MLSGRETAATIVEAVRLGAADYVVKQDDAEGLGEMALEVAIKSAIERTRLVSEISELRDRLRDDQDQATLFSGDNPEMETIANVIERVSDSDITVLIRGESGVGKELVARAIHQRSTRPERPLVKVNCAALPAELLGYHILPPDPTSLREQRTRAASRVGFATAHPRGTEGGPP
jgi:DNA-binding NtrC family response regulator